MIEFKDLPKEEQAMIDVILQHSATLSYIDDLDKTPSQRKRIYDFLLNGIGDENLMSALRFCVDGEIWIRTNKYIRSFGIRGGQKTREIYLEETDEWVTCKQKLLKS